MKTQADPRHLRRIRLLKAIYSYQYSKTKFPPLNPSDRATINRLLARIDFINQHINRLSTKFGVDKMAKIDLSILQLGIFEFLIAKTAPAKVIIDECIELAKEFGGINSSALINGILGKLLEETKYEQSN